MTCYKDCMQCHFSSRNRRKPRNSCSRRTACRRKHTWIRYQAACLSIAHIFRCHFRDCILSCKIQRHILSYRILDIWRQNPCVNHFDLWHWRYSRLLARTQTKSRNHIGKSKCPCRGLPQGPSCNCCNSMNRASKLRQQWSQPRMFLYKSLLYSSTDCRVSTMQ